MAKKIKKRKRSPRPTRYRGRLKKPGTGEAQKKLWADPTYRAMMMEKRKAQGERAKGHQNRLGIPDGMRKADAEKHLQEVKASVAKTMKELEDAGVLDGDDAAANEALEVSLEIMRGKGEKKVRLQAARQVLEFTKAKPASRVHATVDSAEAWLKAIAAQNDDDKQGETSKDA